MPLCYCFTNQNLDSIPSDFETKLTECVSEVLNKPTECIKCPFVLEWVRKQIDTELFNILDNKRIAVVLTKGRVCKADNTGPAFIMQIHSIGVFDEERNPAYFQSLFDFLKEKLALPGNRLQIQFVDISSHMAKSGM